MQCNSLQYNKILTIQNNVWLKSLGQLLKDSVDDVKQNHVERNVMVYFQPGEWMRMMIILESDAGILGKKEIRVLLSGVEPNAFRLLVRMLYHWATGDSWELRPLNHVLSYFQFCQQSYQNTVCCWR